MQVIFKTCFSTSGEVSLICGSMHDCSVIDPRIESLPPEAVVFVMRAIVMYRLGHGHGLLTVTAVVSLIYLPPVLDGKMYISFQNE